MKTLKFYVVFLFFLSFVLSVNEGFFGVLAAGAITLHSLEDLKILKEGPPLNSPRKGDTLKPPRRGDTLKPPNKGTPLNPSQKKSLSHPFPCTKAFKGNTNNTETNLSTIDNSIAGNSVADNSVAGNSIAGNSVADNSTTFNYHTSPTYNYKESDGHPTKKRTQIKSWVAKKTPLSAPLQKSFTIRRAEKNLKRSIPNMQKDLANIIKSETHLKYVRKGLRYNWRDEKGQGKIIKNKNVLNPASRRHLYNRNKSQIVKKRKNKNSLAIMLRTAKAYQFYFKNKKHFRNHINRQMKQQ